MPFLEIFLAFIPSAVQLIVKNGDPEISLFSQKEIELELFVGKKKRSFQI